MHGHGKTVAAPMSGMNQTWIFCLRHDQICFIFISDHIRGWFVTHVVRMQAIGNTGRLWQEAVWLKFFVCGASSSKSPSWQGRRKWFCPLRLKMDMIIQLSYPTQTEAQKKSEGHWPTIKLVWIKIYFLFRPKTKTKLHIREKDNYRLGSRAKMTLRFLVLKKRTMALHLNSTPGPALCISILWACTAAAAMPLHAHGHRGGRLTWTAKAALNV